MPQRTKARLEEFVYVSLQRTADLLARKVERVLRSADVSPTQYNVLRILRGAAEGLPGCEISNRMITRDPDITRLLDRLEKRGLVSRCREKEDRRLVLTRITSEGTKLLKSLDDPVHQAHHEQLGHLGRERLRNLAELLDLARQHAG